MRLKGCFGFPFAACALLVAAWFAPAQERHNYYDSVDWGVASIIVGWRIFRAASRLQVTNAKTGESCLRGEGLDGFRAAA